MKKSFTLIEVMISIVIFSILVLFMSKVVTSLNISLNTINDKYKKENKKSLLVKTLYNDILAKRNIKIKNSKNYSIVYIQTSNSLYNIPMPYVIWYVSKKDNALMRLESSKKITLPINIENDFYLDKFTSNVEIFQIYQKKDKFFVFIKTNKEVYFEM